MRHETQPFFTHGEPAESVSPLLDTLTESVSRWREENTMVGAEMLVVKGRDIIRHETFGWADREDSVPMARNTICRIRSMTKPFVGTAVLMLSERGELTLDDRIAAYIPAFDNEHSDSITIYQLLTHTGGFVQTGFPAGSIYEYASLEEGVLDLGEQGPDNSPGGQFIYSDGGSSTLAYLVETISGMPCEDFLEENIFQPLGLHDTYCMAPEIDSLRRRFASTYQWQQDRFGKYWDNEQQQELPFFRGSGGIYTTPVDYARFLYAWSNPQEGFLSEETKEKALISTEFNAQYALHWEVFHRSDSLGTAFGHGGSDGTVGISFPRRDMIVCFFTQTRGTVAVSLFEKLLFTEMGFEEPARYEEIALDEDEARKIMGTYELKPWQGRIYRDGGEWRIRFNENQPLKVLALSRDEFVIPDIDVRLEFLYDESGDVSRMRFIKGDNVQEFEKIE